MQICDYNKEGTHNLPIMGVDCTSKDDNDLLILSIDANTVDYVILRQVTNPDNFNA